MTINNAVAKRINDLLRIKGITVYRLEKNAGLVHGTVDRILNGLNKTVTFTTIFKLARGFNMDIYEFLNDDVFRSELIEID
ncbi:MAG: helix-turn-helix transcriptional regulator [Clostridia bacterium]|nr:helix-turn-helix transcriptional regulator [Clostridia bacterium]